MRTYAMILDNPGEQPHATRYRDPQVLRDMGYTDLIVYPTTGLSGLLGPDTLAQTEMRQWVADAFDRVNATVRKARAAGLKVHLTYDAPSLAAELVGSASSCVNTTPTALCPASDALLEMSGQCLEALLAEVSDVEGIVLRLGDNDAPRLHYLTGNDIYTPHCPRCASLGRADRLEKFIRYFYDLVVKRLDRSLIVRAWNVMPGGMHDDPDLCARVVERLPADERLMFSFKFTETDFWRYQRWNPSSLVCGDRPIIYELQCQREFEGKGAVPNYQVPLWRDGMPELEGAIGLAEAVKRATVAGLWAWVRGGGWRGPYVTPENEAWIDANVTAVPQLAANPAADPGDLARHWIDRRLQLDTPVAESLLETLLSSPQTVLETFYIGPYARRRADAWHPGADVIQDDQIDADAAWNLIRRLPGGALDEVVAEKAAAEKRIIDQRRALGQLAHSTAPTAAAIPPTLEYAQTLIQTIRSLITGLVAYRRSLRRSDGAAAQAAEKHMRACQSHWVHHSQRVATYGSASAFSSDNLWDVTEKVIDDVTTRG